MDGLKLPERSKMVPKRSKVSAFRCFINAAMGPSPENVACLGANNNEIPTDFVATPQEDEQVGFEPVSEGRPAVPEGPSRI